jgi:hypothetical protein
VGYGIRHAQENAVWGGRARANRSVTRACCTSIPHPRRQLRRPYVDSIHFESVRLRSQGGTQSTPNHREAQWLTATTKCV